MKWFRRRAGSGADSALRRSRVSKALTDSAIATSHASAEGQLDSIAPVVTLSPDLADTPAGQAALLTAAGTALKCFERVGVDVPAPLQLQMPAFRGMTLEQALFLLGNEPVETPLAATHQVLIGEGDRAGPAAVRCWWNRWVSGIRPEYDDLPHGDSGNPLAGVFAGGLAIREIFASLCGDGRAMRRTSIVSLWEPWNRLATPAAGPRVVTAPPSAWLIGLGHLGQGICWNLLTLPLAERPHFVLQDDQFVGTENESTGILLTSNDVGERKTRAVAAWFKKAGWSTALIERRHFGDIAVRPDDPAIVLCGLDSPEARKKIASSQFDYMLDAGVGHGPVDFETIQTHVIRRGDPISDLWTHPGRSNLDRLLKLPAYQSDGSVEDECGKRVLAGASVAVPFVGSAAGALLVAQAVRLASLQPVARSMQLQLSCPQTMLVGRMLDKPTVGIGGEAISASLCTVNDDMEG